MEALIDSLIWLLADTRSIYKNRSDETSQKTAECLKSYLECRVYGLKERIERLERKDYTLAFIGLTNVGKSTLAEALLEAPVAPAISGPGTSFPIEYHYGKDWRLEIRGVTPYRETFSDAHSMANVLQARCLGLSAAEAANVHKACVYGPMPLLEQGLTLADTPGFGAASVDECDAAAVSQRLESYVQKTIDEIYFCISSVDGQVKKEEKSFFDKVKNKCRYVVITKWGEEDESESDERQYRAQYAHLFHPCGMLFVGAREHYGIEKLKELIKRSSSIEDRGKECINQIEELWRDMNTGINDLCYDHCRWERCRLDGFMACCRMYGLKLEESDRVS